MTVIILINISCFNFTVECFGIVGRGMCMCIQLLLVSGLFSAFGFPFLSPREFSGFTPQDEGNGGAGSHLIELKDDFQSVLRILESFFMTLVLFHVRRLKM